MTLLPRLALSLTLSLSLAGLARAQDKAAIWTPPPAIELVKLIPEQPAQAAALIRKSWGDK
ncbi:MAG: hypothetical protein KDM64_11845, partial [Verrucomicrobiae bacterium]|nr:hypothetical protein [Verrucomicrobiae bacterium]